MTDLIRKTLYRPIRFSKQFNAMLEDMGRLVDGFTGTSPLDGLYDGFIPATNVYIEDNQKVIEMELPGLCHEDLSIDVKDDTLKISGEKHSQQDCDEKDFISCEIVSGSFERSFVLEAAELENTDNISAIFKNGILKICIPMTEREKEARKIDIVLEE